MEVMHEHNDRNFPLDLAAVEVPLVGYQKCHDNLDEKDYMEQPPAFFAGGILGKSTYLRNHTTV